MKLKRRLAGPDEVESIYHILRVCGQDMKDRLGLDHWVPPFPLDFLHTQAQERRMYAVYKDAHLVATVTIGDQAPPYYLTSPGLSEAWDACGGEPALYVNRLAVLPQWQRQGIGTWSMREVEQIALDEEYLTIRFDAYEKNLSLVAWYEHLGYQVRGNFPLVRSTGGAKKVTCMEKTRKDFAMW